MANTPFKMKGSPMQRNFGIGSPMRTKGGTLPVEPGSSGSEKKKKKKKTLGEWFKGTKLGKDLKGLGEKIQSSVESAKTSTPESRKATVRKGFEKASERRSESAKKRSEQIKKIKSKLFIPKKKK